MRTTLIALLSEAFAAVDGALIEGAPLYVAHPAGNRMPSFLAAFLAQGWTLRQGLVWVKDSMVLGHSDYQLPPRADPVWGQAGSRALRARDLGLVRR